jgi:hypothetical protein
MNDAYRAQVRLLLDVLPLVAEEKVFALKGGAAINLFVRDLPRLSVDIDLTYLPLDDRSTAFTRISDALRRIKARILSVVPGSRAALVDQGGGMEVKLHVQRARTQIKIEVNPTLRGHLLPVRMLPTVQRVEEVFEAFVEMAVVSHGELFGGKICAALDRQHPRDLFDVRLLLNAEGIADEVRHGLIAGLVGHNRPASELLSGRMQDRQPAFTAEFAGMTLEPFDYAAHTETFLRLVHMIQSALTADDRKFLVSVEAGDPDWGLFVYASLVHLPAVQWKLLNIRKLKESNPVKHAEGVDALKKALGD